MGQRSVPAPFLTKTYHLVDDPTSDDVISWNEVGTAFVVWKTAEFSKDFLPNYFKHNNFSSFVRQLNTYGFRKTVPDKWEFANENFKRGQKELLMRICRRKTTTSEKTVATDNNVVSPSISGSSSTSSPDSKNPSSLETAQIADLSDENEKLRNDNKMLTSELARTKKQCDELIAFLKQCVKVAPDQISRIVDLEAEAGNSDCGDDENENCMKLFGVVVKKKRGYSCDDNAADLCGQPKKKQTKLWTEIAALPGESNKVA